jgi:hypothetical protein
VFLYAFDLIELNGDDLRRDPLQVRKATLASILAKASPGLSTLSGVDLAFYLFLTLMSILAVIATAVSCWPVR